MVAGLGGDGAEEGAGGPVAASGPGEGAGAGEGRKGVPPRVREAAPGLCQAPVGWAARSSFTAGLGADAVGGGTYRSVAS